MFDHITTTKSIDERNTQNTGIQKKIKLIYFWREGKRLVYSSFRYECVYD